MLALVSGKVRPDGAAPPLGTPALPALAAPPRPIPAAPPLAPEFPAPLAAALPPVVLPPFAPAAAFAPATPGDASCDEEPHAAVVSHSASTPARRIIELS